MEKTKAAAFLLMLLIVLPMSSIALLVQGQNQLTLEQNMVKLAEQAENQIRNLIDSVNSNETAIAKIENASLLDDWQNNVTLYETDGLAKLAAAQEALTNSDYDLAAESALEALTVFREVYSSLNKILEATDLQKNDLIDCQELLDAINRDLNRIDVLREILPDNASQEIWDLLDAADASLDTAKELLLDGKIDAARNLFLEAKQKIIQVYDYLKVQAEDSNTWRLNQYCEKLQQRVQERFRYGQEQNINFTAALQASGYQNENQFMQEIQNRIQNAQNQDTPQNAIQQCETISQMVQEMEQALNQEINNQQGGAGAETGDNGSGAGGTGSNGAGPSATTTPGTDGGTAGGTDSDNSHSPSSSSVPSGNGGKK
ncbi:MAG: hypothetical protein WC325_13910 [Candidatus Bathyarchaeia archaeon]|jgi:flagellar biosynthesis chaperone FliJ